MSVAALSSHAVVRFSRTAAVRRALLVVVFLGGFLALGILLGGGTAHAAQAERGGSLSGLLSGDRDGGTGDDASGEQLTSSLRQASVKAPVGFSIPSVGDVEKATEPVGGVVEDITGIDVRPPSGGDDDGEQPDTPSDDASSHGPSASDGGRDNVFPTSNVGSRQSGGESAADDELSRLPAGSRQHERTPDSAPVVPFGFTVHSAGDGGGARGGADSHGAAWSAITADVVLPAGGVAVVTESPLRDRPSEVLELPG